MKIKDTLKNKKVEINKGKENHIFVCGPTVYDYSHIGHARTYLFFDIFIKYLKNKNYKIKYVQNITNIDDKIINKAKKTKDNPIKISEKFENEYYKDMESLGINSVDHYVKATDVIPEIISQVKNLINKGFAYQTKTGVYFQVRKFKSYGKLSNQNIDALKSGTRINTKEDKKDNLDFALWKSVNIKENSNEKEPVIKDGEPAWQSPWGWGRPGWHIEDTAISEKFFGPQYEIHGGGEDLKFPHHESEIAQQEAASGKEPFVQIWMHTGALTVNGKKMGKSLNNFITIRDFLKNCKAETLRFMVLSHHYRSRFDYTKKTIDETNEALQTIKDFVYKNEFNIKNTKKTDPNLEIETDIIETKEKIDEIISDDFNTPKALGEIFKFIKKYQNKIWNLNSKNSEKINEFITEIFKAFGFKFEKNNIPKEITDLVKERDKFRSNKQFINSDKLRKKIKDLGYIIEDTPLGSFVKKIN
jgi:cysteinyl-tRNA synthetase